MYSFFILGQVPGTDMVISFWMWAEMAALLTMLLVWITYRRHLAVINYSLPTISPEIGTFQTATAQ